MTKIYQPFDFDGDLIVVKARITGPRGTFAGQFIVDTGATITTLSSSIADRIGYSARDGIDVVKTHTIVGEEVGYTLLVAELSVLGITTPNFLLQVFDLDPDVDGLLGMNFLADYNFEVRPLDQQMLLEPLAASFPMT
jgi:clan AA aspartic protease (TIGR02281 family)